LAANLQPDLQPRGGEDLMVFDLEEIVCALLADGIVSEKERAAELERLEREKRELEHEIEDMKRQRTSTS
jgi:cell division protein FtsB